MKELKAHKFFTPFSVFLNEKKEDGLDKIGVTDIDKMIYNFENNRFILLEEKCRSVNISDFQLRLLKKIDACCKHDEDYQGTWLIKHSRERPDDGGTCHIALLDDIGSSDDIRKYKKVSMLVLKYFLRLNWTLVDGKPKLDKEEKELYLKERKERNGKI